MITHIQEQITHIQEQIEFYSEGGRFTREDDYRIGEYQDALTELQDQL